LGPQRLLRRGGEAGEAGARVDPAPIVKKLKIFRDKAIKKKIPGLEKSLNEMIGRLGEPGAKLTPEDAWMLKQGFWDEIFGEAGRELSKRGKGKTIKAAGKIAGGELIEKLEKSLIEQGFEGAPELFAKYGAASELAKSMTKPFKGYFQGSIVGGALGAVGLPEVGVPVAMAVMPYTRYLMQQLLGRVVGAGLTGAKAGTVSALQQFLEGEK